MREVKAGEYYRHFKGGLYQVTGIAKDAGTERPVVVYQALYGEEELWVRDYEEFVSEVDRAKYPDAEQQYRFEKIEEPKESNPLLLRFLLESIAVSLDIVLGKGSTKEKYRQVLNCLKTMEHFETNRFR